MIHYVAQYGIRRLRDCGLYEVAALDLITVHADRFVAANISRFHGDAPGRGDEAMLRGDVHLNVLDPGAKAGNHYHERIIEFFVNPGPGPLLLHLKAPASGEVQTVEMPAPHRRGVHAFRAKHGVSHVVENPNEHVSSLIIILDRDDPDDKAAEHVC